MKKNIYIYSKCEDLDEPIRINKKGDKQSIQKGKL
jgi:hypothetical protein